MYQDEADFGRINRPRRCWSVKGKRPIVPCHRVREYRYCYGAVEPIGGESFFIVAGNCNTDWINEFLRRLSQQYKDDYLILIMDNAVWHKSKTLEIPENIELMFIPPYTPELNPIEQIWKEIREKGFANEAFPTLEHVIDRLCETINNLTKEVIKSICARKWLTG